MSAIEHYDQRYHKEAESVLAQESIAIPLQRPDTAGRHRADAASSVNASGQYCAAVTLSAGDRPPTQAVRLRPKLNGSMAPIFGCNYGGEDVSDQKSRHEEHFPVGQVLLLKILGTWGDPHYVGLTGIEACSYVT